MTLGVIRGGQLGGRIGRLRARHVFAFLFLLGVAQFAWLASDWFFTNPEDDLDMEEVLADIRRENNLKWKAKFPGGLAHMRDSLADPCASPVANRSAFAQVKTTPDLLMEQMEKSWHWAWIKARIEQLWPQWIQTASQLKQLQATNRTKYRILILPGFLTQTDFASPTVISKGGPLGELVTWSDLVAALEVMGHDVTVEYSVLKASHLLRWYLCECSGGCCPTGFDLIYTDYGGLGSLPKDVRDGIRFKLRVVDWFGTDAMYNDPDYAHDHGVPADSAFSLHLQQFLTAYPTSSDNSFLGFAISDTKLTYTKKSDIGIIYGKDARYALGKEAYLTQLSKHMTLHATMARARFPLPDGIVNHGIMSSEDFKNITSAAKVYIGLGDPIEGPSPLEVLARGAVFLNPKFKTDQQKLRGKPTARKVTSQVPYLEEYVGPPHVFTLDIYNVSQVEQAITEALDGQVEPFIPYEFSVKGYLERLNYYVSHQDFCRKGTHLTLKRALTVTRAPPGVSCMAQCRKQGLFCEPSLFPEVNDAAAFKRHGITCSETTSQPDIIYPAYSDSALAPLVVELVFPRCAHARLRDTDIDLHKKRIRALVKGPPFGMYMRVMDMKITTGSIAEGLSVEEGWGHAASDTDDLRLYHGPWNVQSHDIGPPASGLRSVFKDFRQRRISSKGYLLLDQSDCPPSYYRVRVEGDIDKLTTRLAETGRGQGRAVGRARAVRCIVEHESHLWLSSHAAMQALRRERLHATDDISGPAESHLNSTWDIVPGLVCTEPPPAIQEYLSRHRRTAWPLSDTLIMLGRIPAILVAVGHRRSARRDLEWRLSWSLHELILANDMPAWVKQGYWAFRYSLKYMQSKQKHLQDITSEDGHTDRNIQADISAWENPDKSQQATGNQQATGRSHICSYHLKTCLLWQLEDPESWLQQCPYKLLQLLLVRLAACLKDRNIPQYFIPECNLLECVDDDEVATLQTCLSNMQSDVLSLIKVLLDCPAFPKEIYNSDKFSNVQNIQEALWFAIKQYDETPDESVAHLSLILPGLTENRNAIYAKKCELDKNFKRSGRMSPLKLDDIMSQCTSVL